MQKKIDKDVVNDTMMTLVHDYALERGLDIYNYHSVDHLYSILGYDLGINIPVMLGVESTSELMEQLHKIDEYS